MNIVGILLAIITVGTLLYAAFVLLKERYTSARQEAAPTPPNQFNPPVLPFVAPKPKEAITPVLTSEIPNIAQPKELTAMSFEDYVSARFDEKYFSVDNTDNLTDFALTVRPDFTFMYHDSFHSIRFAVECKYRPAFSKDNTLIISKEQLDSYRFYQQENKIPVYIILGVGGAADAPERIYILPLKDISPADNVLTTSFLSKYRKFSIGSNFFFHPELMVLR